MAKRKSAKPSTQSPKPVERQGKLYLPQEIMEYAGVAPDMLRDWRRRGLIDGFGMILLPDGSTTSNLEHPALLEVLRPQWVYTISDLTALAIARHLNAELRLDLKDALQLATSMNAKVLAWLPGHYGNLTRDYREPRFVLAWPSERGDNLQGAPQGMFATVAVADLNRITAYAGAAAIVIDCKELASELPPALRMHLAEIE